MVIEKIKSILSEQFDVEEDSVNLETNLVDDLGADSLDIADLLATIEDEFDIEIGKEDSLENIQTVGDIVNYINKIR
ncbi:MAG: acyl carrier protein [Oscillospiraceae bacterium]|nr:acyl carrier protein [Oscillospiraceae bacterium]